MPELPEVEIIKRGLGKVLPGLFIKDIQILAPKSFQGDPKKIIGKKIIGVERRGKMLLLAINGNQKTKDSLLIIIHLKMSGQLIWLGEKDKLVGGHPTGDMLGKMPKADTRVIFEFSDRSKLYFNDQRRFGWIRINSKLQVTEKRLLSGLGPEPLDKNFTSKIFKEKLLRRKNTPIKVAIMDQSVLAGVGNIYAAEALFRAKILPQRLVKSLKDSELKRIHKAIKEALVEGIKHGGSTRAHFINIEGLRGRFLDYAYVYGRKGLPCKVCKRPIKKITLAGRGSFYCPHCQSR